MPFIPNPDVCSEGYLRHISLRASIVVMRFNRIGSDPVHKPSDDQGSSKPFSERPDTERLSQIERPAVVQAVRDCTEALMRFSSAFYNIVADLEQKRPRNINIYEKIARLSSDKITFMYGPNNKLGDSFYLTDPVSSNVIQWRKNDKTGVIQAYLKDGTGKEKVFSAVTGENIDSSDTWHISRINGKEVVTIDESGATVIDMSKESNEKYDTARRAYVEMTIKLRHLRENRVRSWWSRNRIRELEQEIEKIARMPNWSDVQLQEERVSLEEVNAIFQSMSTLFRNGLEAVNQKK